MRDYHEAARPRTPMKAVGIRELKTHAARSLRHVREARASYVLTHRGRAVGVILPIDAEISTAPEAEDADAAWNAFMRAGHRLESRFRPGVGGVRLLSAMRR